MIILKTVRYKNFLSTGNEFIEIQLNKHKNTLISGQNGSGKSVSCTDTIFYALFGRCIS